MVGHRVDRSDEDLIRDLYPGLRRFAAVVAPPDADPNDLVQEVLVRALRRGPLTRFDHPGAYLRRALLNEAAGLRRRFVRRRTALARLGPPRSPQPDYVWEVEELLGLPPKERAVLYLNVIEGRPFEEIAGMIGGSAASLRMTATRARRRLRALIEEECGRATA